MKNKKSIIIVLVLVIIVASIVVILLKKNTQPSDVIPSGNEDNATVVNPPITNPVVDNSDLGDNIKILEDGRAMNISPNLNKTRDFDGFNISDIRFSRNNGELSFVADIKNISKNDKNDYSHFKITLYDKDKNEMGTMTGMINPLKKDETITLISKARGDVQNCINADDFKIEVEKK